MRMAVQKSESRTQYFLPAFWVIGIASSWEVKAPEELGVLEQAWLQSALYAVQTMEEVHGTL